MIEILQKSQILKDKKIILGVSASISIYKSIEVMRLLQKCGASVRVVMSDRAREFVSPIIFESLSGNLVLTKDSQSWSNPLLNHIEIAKWGDVFLLAPISANSINKLSYGFSDNVLLESFLAFKGKKIIAPSANTNMIENKITQESLVKLESIGVEIISPQSKELACKIVGNGALSDVLEIVYRTIRILLLDLSFVNKNICISAGGSKECIDSVRYISNFSSGKMGSSIALAAYFLGARVSVVGDIPFIIPQDILLHKAKSTNEYLFHIEKWQHTIDNKKDSILFMCAAISDYVPLSTSDVKLKKSEIGKEWNLKLKENIDILKSILKSQITIGFKLESSNGLISATNTLSEKNIDAICLNEMSNNPLNSDDNEIIFITKDKNIKLNKDNKLSLAFRILNEAIKL